MVKVVVSISKIQSKSNSQHETPDICWLIGCGFYFKETTRIVGSIDVEKFGLMKLVLHSGKEFLSGFTGRIIICTALRIDIGDFLLKPAFA